MLREEIIMHMFLCLTYCGGEMVAITVIREQRGLRRTEQTSLAAMASKESCLERREGRRAAGTFLPARHARNVTHRDKIITRMWYGYYTTKIQYTGTERRTKIMRA